MEVSWTEQRGSMPSQLQDWIGEVWGVQVWGVNKGSESETWSEGWSHLHREQGHLPRSKGHL